MTGVQKAWSPHLVRDRGEALLQNEVMHTRQERHGQALMTHLSSPQFLGDSALGAGASREPATAELREGAAAVGGGR